MNTNTTTGPAKEETRRDDAPIDLTKIEKADISLLTKYFHDLTDRQKEQLSMLQGLYEWWNARINVVSRKDISELYTHHVLHSMAIAKFIRFAPGTRVVDVGTGGGFPGIPLAIMNPEADFTLIDSIGKKIKVVNGVAEALGLTNVHGMQKRSDEFKEKFDFVVSRGVCSLPEFVRQTRHLVSPENKNAIMNGIIYLKGGDMSGEMQPFGHKASEWNIKNYFTESFFEEKKIIHLEF